MTPTTAEALEKSIAHWERMATGNRIDDEKPSASNCALCREFKDDECLGCPVKARTGRALCGGSPYGTAAAAWEKHGIDSPKFRAAALLERDFLVSLREPVEEKKEVKAPWQLPPPPEGREWHRNDWQESMLPEGWRPLLKGELVLKGDWFQSTLGWTQETVALEAPMYSPSKWHYRTRRPLPTPPVLVPLEYSDIPIGSAIMRPGCVWHLILSVEKDGVRTAMQGFLSFVVLKASDWSILRPGESWTACSKERLTP